MRGHKSLPSLTAMKNGPDRDFRVLIFAPIGRDGPASANVLARAGVATYVCSEFAELIEAIKDGAAATVMAEEGLFGKDMECLYDWVRNQPAWSDLPFILLTSHREPSAIVEWRRKVASELGNVSILERPVHPITLTSTIKAALRARGNTR